MIDSYLTNKTDLDDAAVHLLFCANRWEKRSACKTLALLLCCKHMSATLLVAEAAAQLYPCVSKSFDGLLYLCREAMVAALQSGTTLVVDRYSYSGVVFTAAKQLPGLDLNWCKVRNPSQLHIRQFLPVHLRCLRQVFNMSNEMDNSCISKVVWQ